MIKENKLLAFLLFLGSAFLTIKNEKSIENIPLKERYQLLYPTFLGNSQRNFYGKEVPDNLEILWKIFIGSGKTKVGKKISRWLGTGWTGQPTLIKEFDKSYIIIGGFDYNLRKIDAQTGETIWSYRFDDIIKGTATIFRYIDSLGPTLEEKLVILQGSRIGFEKSMDDKEVSSFRAINFETGKELWRLNIERTESYSRDVDGSALTLDSLIFIGAENGIFYVLNKDSRIIKKIKLYENEDIMKHKGNLVIESSPVLFQNRIYISAGSGYVYGINLKTFEPEWKFYIGSDLDGTISITKDSCLIVPIEKQYIANGGIIKLDPKKDTNAVVWYFPTGNKKFGNWKGGVIGSAAVQDSLVTFRAIDGYLYLINQFVLDSSKVYFNNKKYYKPKLLSKIYLGPSISTPLIIDDKIVTAGYDNKLKILKIIKSNKTELSLIDSFISKGSFESTPLVEQSKIYIGCRDGFFYCLGKREKRKNGPATNR